MVVQGLLDHCSTNAQTSVSMKTGLLEKAVMRSMYLLEFQALKPRELLGASAYPRIVEGRGHVILLVR